MKQLLSCALWRAVGKLVSGVELEEMAESQQDLVQRGAAGREQLLSQSVSKIGGKTRLPS